MRFPRASTVALILGCCVAVAACAFNPITGRPQAVLTSQGAEREMGAAEAKKVAALMGIAADPERSAYVEAIGRRLISTFPTQGVEYSFQIVDMPDPNAFALPGGYVYVSRGLLALANSEDELACVIGHEIGHVLARHTGRRLTVAAPIALATGIGALATSIVSPTLGQVVAGVGKLTGGLVLSPYSRNQEREADTLGMELAARAGWDPEGMSHFLRTLEREEVLREGRARPFSFFASHPTTPERVRNTEREARKLERAPGEPILANQEALYARLDGLLIGPNPAEGVFLDDRFVHPDLGFALDLPAGWEKENSRTQVAAAEPKGDAVVVLRDAGEGGNPAERAAEAAKQLGVDTSQVRQVVIHGWPAARLQAVGRSSQGPVAVDATWIAHRDSVYQVVGVCPASRATSFQATFDRVARSFRSLSDADRARIRETRLRVTNAQPRETLAALVQRTNSAWKPAEVAVANSLEVDSPLAAGQPVKVARTQAYGNGGN